jgi:hypothetical protein
MIDLANLTNMHRIETGVRRRVVIGTDPARGGIVMYSEVQEDDGTWGRRGGFVLVPPRQREDLLAAVLRIVEGA